MTALQDVETPTAVVDLERLDRNLRRWQEHCDRTGCGRADRRAGVTRAGCVGRRTPTMWESADLRPTVTEYRAGVYAFHDRPSVAAGAASLDDAALTVHATVVSRSERDLAILDAGSKALSMDPGPSEGFGLVLEAPAARIERLCEEHGFVRLGEGETLELGDRVRIVPNHACVVANLFDELVVVHGDGAVERWPVDGRPLDTGRVEADRSSCPPKRARHR